MLRVLGSQRRLCDGLSRRELLQVGASSLLGLGAADLAALQTAAAAGESAPLDQRTFGRAKSVILLFLYGGASQLETFDPKPEAPLEIRGQLNSIPTSLPGTAICEGLPQIAKIIDRTTVIRSMTHPYPIHGTAFSVTATPTLETPMQDNPQDARHWPFIGSVVDFLDDRRLGGASPVLPRNIGVPFLHSSRRRHAIHNAGPYAAYLGHSFDPVWTEFEGEALHSQKYHFETAITTVVDPYGGVKPDCRFRWSRIGELPAEMTLDRLNRRASLLAQFDQARRDFEAHDRIAAFNRSRQTAYAMLATPAMREALDLSREPAAVRERYGMTLFGQASLLARRLVEAGGRFVTAFWDEYGQVNSAWDTHFWHYPRLTEQLLPGLDMAYSALIADLEQRGLLDETLVILTTEHGRTPKLDPNGDHPSGTAQGGRNHWSRAYSTVLAGAGIKRGHVLGKTDRFAGEVIDRPVSPKDILATAYHLLGIDPQTLIHDRLGRPVPIAGSGRVLADVLA